MTTPARRVWFVDTSSLISLAACPDLKPVVQTAVGTDAIALLDVVVAELEHRGRFDGLAAAAQSDLAWLGPPVDSGRYVRSEDARQVQLQVADGRALVDEFEHWAESVTIAMLRAALKRGSKLPTFFLTEDHSARIQANKVDTCTPLSLHRLLWERVRAGKLDAAEAEGLAAVLHEKGRGPECTAEDFANHSRRRGIGRVGAP